MRKIHCLLLIVLITCWACEKDDPIPGTGNPEFSEGMIISNEGGFGFGNASVSFYDLERDTLHRMRFEQANGAPLGDVLQSISIIEDLAYLVVNNSNKIEVVALESFKSVATITGLTSPRYLAPIDAEKAYVTDLYANAISIIDLNQHEVVGTIALEGWSEELILVNDEMFVTIRDNSFLFVIDTQTDQITDSIAVGFNPSTLQLDKDGKLWVLCSGNQTTGTLGGLYRIDPESRTLLQQLPFSDTNIGGWPRLRINESRDTLYYLKENVFQLPIGNTNLPEDALIAANGRIFYGLGIKPKTGRIFVSDVIDYQQQGLIYEYNQKGIMLNRFNAGVIPNDFTFY